MAGVYVDTDNVGNPTYVSWWPKVGFQQLGPESVYGYDQINRLDEAGFDLNGYPSGTTPFTYDWVGNRTGTNWGAVNDVDQLPSDPYGNSYAYDTTLGNLVTRTKNSVNTTFEYDNYNLLKKINWPGGSNTQFVSDSAGNRLSMTTSQGVGYNFMYDVTAGIPAVLMEQEGTETPKIYVRTPDGRLIASITATVTNPSLDFYYHFDQLGSTLALTNSSGTATDTFKYDAWGKVTRLTGTTTQPYLFVGQLGYYTHYQDQKLDPESQDGDKYVMLQLGVRYYALEIGRFTQRDALPKDEVSSYTYTDDDPTIGVDPTGLKSKKSPPPQNALNDPGIKECLKVLEKCIKSGVPYGHSQDYVNKVLKALQRIRNGSLPVQFKELGEDRMQANCRGIDIDPGYWKANKPKIACATLLHELIHAGSTLLETRRQGKREREDECKKCYVYGPYEEIADDMYSKMGCTKLWKKN